MPQTVNNKIQRAFSESAKGYDRFSGFHREIADKLVAQLVKEPVPSAFLDVGCGTGYLTVKIKENFPESQVMGLDFAQGMIDVARTREKNIEWVLGDCHQLPFADNVFDMVSSNLAYQWSQDLTQSFNEVKRVLISNGVLICTLFGYKTCQELFQSIEEVKPGFLQFNRLPDKPQVNNSLLMGGFKNINVDSESIQLQFKDMHELMTWLKSIGANNVSREVFLGRELISKAASIYREKFGSSQGVKATFEVIKVYAKK